MKVGTVAQWHSVGVTRGYFRSLVNDGELVQIRHRVYVTRAALAAAKRRPGLDQALQAMAAMLTTTSRRVAASHETAARIHGLDLLHPPPAELITLTRPPGSPTRRGSDLRLMAASLPASDVTSRHGVPVTRVARTVIDLARTLPFMNGVVVADSALHQGKVTKDELTAALNRWGRSQGAARARWVVEFSDARAESVLESCARVVFERNGLEPPELQTYIRTEEADYRVDFYWPKYRTIAEADGLKKYDTKTKAVAQLKRDQLLRETGRHVLHFTWDDVFYREPRLIGRVTETFTAQSPPASR